jgi:orsellinic acid C2-O-methyltransferase
MTATRESIQEARRLMNGFRAYQSLVVACKLNLPDLVAAEPRNAESLAAVTGTHAQSLRRLLRGLVAWRVFTEDAEGRFHATDVSDHFRSDTPGLRNITVMLSAEGYLAWSEALEAVRTGAPVFEKVFGRSRWQQMAENPDDAGAFNAAMVETTTRIAGAFVEAFDFSGVHTVVDVGGGNGALLVAVLKAQPGIKGVLFDQPAGLAGAKKKMRAEGLDRRVELVEGSFFESVPEGADLYLLKSIIHDWDEPQGLAILRTCRVAMTAPGSRLVLVERTMPETIDDPDDALGIVMSDLHMMVVLGGRERTPAEYGDLLSRAGLRMTRHIAFDPEFGAVEAVL